MRKAFLILLMGFAGVLACTAVVAASPETEPRFLMSWGSEGTGAGQFEAVRYVAVDPSGRIFVSDAHDRIQVFLPDSTYVGQLGGSGTAEGQLDFIGGIAVDALGRTYVSEDGNARVQVFDPDGSFAFMWGWGVSDGSAEWQRCTSGCQKGISGAGEGQFTRPAGIAVAPDGTVYVAERGAGRIQRFTPNGEFISQWGNYGSGPGQLTSTGGVACDASGNVYVVGIGIGEHRVQKFTANGGFILEWGSLGAGPGEFDGPRDVQSDRQGRIYVTDEGNDRFQIFDENGVYESEWGDAVSGSNIFASPTGLAVTPDRVVYVADFLLSNVMKFGFNQWPLFSNRLTTPSTSPLPLGTPAFFDSVDICVTRAPGDSFYVSGACDGNAPWIVKDNLYVETSDTGPGNGGDLGYGQPAGVPVDSLFIPVPARNVTSLIPLGTSTVRFKLAETERTVYGNGPLFLIRETPAPATTGTPHQHRPFAMRVSANPFRSTVGITLAAEGGNVNLDVLDVRGRLVRRVHAGYLPPGGQTLVWDGRDDRGEPTRPGIYFLLAVGESQRESVKVVRLP